MRRLFISHLQDQYYFRPESCNFICCRFLALKNLATVFVQLGSAHYESALQCYLQAVEFDVNDSVVWNHLGTLSCKMGLLSISRWAFEQGLLCSPNNWNCMEKLLEVLIAIADEVACLSVANMILRHWPSHSRALHVKKMIEDAEPIPFAPRGIDKLEPKHVRLKFPEKRKSTETDAGTSKRQKREIQNIEINLIELTWSALLDSISEIFLPSTRKVPGSTSLPNEDDTATKLMCNRNGKELSCGAISENGAEGTEVLENIDWITCTKIHICLPESSEVIADSAEVKEPSTFPVTECANVGHGSLEKTTVVKETTTEKEQPQERRSTRLERMRSRKLDKDSEASGKDQAKVVFQFLEPFILKKPVAGDQELSSVPSGSGSVFNISVLEHNHLVEFITKASKNFGAQHLVHLLLEEVAHKSVYFQDSFVKFLELEKFTRNWGQDRSPLCSLFLAELYYGQGSELADKGKRLEFFSEASYHLCKVIEIVTYDLPNDVIGIDSHFTSSEGTLAINYNKNLEVTSDDTIEEHVMLPFDSFNGKNENVESSSLGQDKNEVCSTLIDNDAFWIRFFWLSAHLSLSQDCKSKASSEFNICLSLLRNSKKSGSSDPIILPHCKFVEMLTVDRLLHEINLLKLESLLGKPTDELMEKGNYSECINLLSPLLLSSKGVYPNQVSLALEERERFSWVELSALNLVLSACEKIERMDIQLYLNFHLRKLQLLTVAAGMVDYPTSKRTCSSISNQSAFDLDCSYSIGKDWMTLVVAEVKDISRYATKLKNVLEEPGTDVSFESLACVIADIQSLLLTVMCNIVRTINGEKMYGTLPSNQNDQLEIWCMIDAAISFCKLQHLDLSLPAKTHVDLIVAVHDLLAEYGICCAGKDSDGEEGTFLKFAIKHLLALDVKLKSSSGTNGQDEIACLHNTTSENVTLECTDICNKLEKHTEVLANEKTPVEIAQDSSLEQCQSIVDADDLSSDEETEELELAIDTALDQIFFCLYGLKINPDSSSEEELAVHRNSSRGDYQTKEQCADVFQYLLPYAKGLSRTGMVKLRRVLKAIRKHFPQPPDNILADNVIDKFLDGPDLWEEKLQELTGSSGSRELIIDMLNGGKSPDTSRKSSFVSSDQYLEVHSNLYYFISQAEDTSATDKHPGFVLKKEGEEFVEQSSNILKYDLIYNPLRFDSWQKLANIYDEEVDLLLNDGSKHVNTLDWRKNTTLHQRVEVGRRRSKRCLMMSLALANTPNQQSEIHELLGLVYYDHLQNVVPFYDQRSMIPMKDATWLSFCQNSMKHFEKAFELKPEWLHAFYLGKLCEKMGYSPARVFYYYSRAASLNPSAVDPVYRLHASRLKLLYTHGKQNIDITQIVAAYAFSLSTKYTVLNLFGWTTEDLQWTSDVKAFGGRDDTKAMKSVEPSLLESAWHILFDDCVSALRTCVEGELKHFHKARYRLAQGLFHRGDSGDLDRAKEELSFCFRSSRSLFTMNMWEIDGTARKGKKKNPGLAGTKRSLEVSLSESSRKFITCIRKYILLYLNLLEKTGDMSTLERAYTYLRTDKRFYLALGDIATVALGKYIQALVSYVRNTQIHRVPDSTPSLLQTLKKLFNLFMDHVNLWADIMSLPELNTPDMLDSNIYGYIHQYIHLLESDIRLDTLEGINEKIRKRFKNPKLSNPNFAKICKHASLAWCRAIIIKLALITPVPDAGCPHDQPAAMDNQLVLLVDLQPDELLVSPLEVPPQSKGLDMNWFEALSKIKNIRIRQASEENMEAAVTLMRSTFNFYRDSASGTFPSGINLYTVPSSLPTIEGPLELGKNVVDILDLSTQRKLLLWAYTLVHGRYSNISAVIKYCEETKPRQKKGSSSGIQHAAIPVSGTQPGASREKVDEVEHCEAGDSSFVSMAPASQNPELQPCGPCVPSISEAQRSIFSASPLQRCNSNADESTGEGCKESSIPESITLKNDYES